MSKTILYIAASVDGFIAGTSDDLSWLNPYQDVETGYKEFFASVGAIIEGRRTYEIEVKNGWDKLHSLPLFVLSKDVSHEPTRAGVTFTHDDIARVLQKAKAAAGNKNVWIEGGASVAQQFISRGLIDEIVLTLIPVLLGDGIRLFDNIHERFNLFLTDVKRFDKGMIQLVYKL
ncbi:MAG TPA: dihydrofolate reductase family protein [Candidatus Methanoperedens sp.]